jgi:hypothetical protein
VLHRGQRISVAEPAEILVWELHADLAQSGAHVEGSSDKRVIVGEPAVEAPDVSGVPLTIKVAGPRAPQEEADTLAK